MKDKITQTQSVSIALKKTGIPIKVVVGLAVSILPYFWSVYECLPCMMNPRSCVWAEGFGFTYLLSFFAIPLNVVSLILGVISLIQSKKYQKQRVVKVMAIVVILLSAVYFAVNFLMVDLVHVQITNAGGY